MWLDGARNRVHLRRFDFASVDAFVARHRDTSVENHRGPLSFRVKNTELLREAQRHGLSPECVLFDSWYAASTLLHLLADLGWKYVARLKSNRLFD